MGNNIHCSKSNNFNDFYTGIEEANIVDLKNNYKIIYVDYLDPDLVHANMYERNAFVLPRKKNIVNNMLEYYLNHNDRAIYKKTDYLCNEKEKICICNTHAADLRKIYEGVNYLPNQKYISWFQCN
jgi:hypothetical protein